MELTTPVPETDTADPDPDLALPDTGEPTTPTITGVPGFTRDYPGQADYYWVEGLGLVYEKHVDTETEATILEKTLTSTSGL
jgi:hypothetical protein